MHIRYTYVEILLLNRTGMLRGENKESTTKKKKKKRTGQQKL